MVNNSWRVVVEGLRDRRVPTPEQSVVAAQLGITLDPKWHSYVAAAYIRQHLGVAIGNGTLPASEESAEYAVGLARTLRVRIPVEHRGSAELVDSWIGALHDLRAERRLRQLRPCVGDIVEVDAKSFASNELPIAEIASIGADGQLNFRGGRGARARPHRVEIVARVGDAHYDKARTGAANLAARRRGALPALNDSHRAELEPYLTRRLPDMAAQSALEEALANAVDEKPLQQVLERFPELLAPLFTATHGIWVIPRPPLAGRHVPDFLVATQTSMGVRWWLIELESPTEKLHLQNGHLAKAPRQGINQVEDWRELIRTHQAIASLPKSEGGWGFPGLRPDADGLVIVGRGGVTSHTDVARVVEAKAKGIEIRTYDWLLNARRPIAAIGALDAELKLDDVF